MAFKRIWINCNLNKPFVYPVGHLFQRNNIHTAVKGKPHPEVRLHWKICCVLKSFMYRGAVFPVFLGRSWRLCVTLLMSQGDIPSAVTVLFNRRKMLNDLKRFSKNPRASSFLTKRSCQMKEEPRWAEYNGCCTQWTQSHRTQCSYKMTRSSSRVSDLRDDERDESMKVDALEDLFEHSVQIWRWDSWTE